MNSAAEQSQIGDLLDRGDSYARAHDVKAAVSFYQSALKTAAEARISDFPTQGRLRQAAAYIAEQVQAYKAALAKVIEQRPNEPEKTDPLRHAVEILTGDRELFQQAPTVFYYPYLANRQFFEREEFEWVAALEAKAAEIKAELEALLNDGADFQPYIEDEADRPRRSFHGLHGDPSWTALYLWKDGKRVEENAARCPKTMAAVDRVPMTRIGARTPSVLFSRLTPGAHIPPHRGMLNCRLICHLPMIVPPGCWLRVGNETRHWREGELLIFDDSFEHEAKNESAETRIVLLFDMWRPELGDDEQAGISAIFETIDHFTTLPPA